jgi:putative redox protein
MQSIKVSSTASRFQQQIAFTDFHLIADEPIEVGGDNSGPTPVEFVLAGLGACKTMTVKMYAERKGWALTHVSTEIDYQKGEQLPQILVHLELEGDLTAEQCQRLLEIADKCPVHKLLTTDVRIQTLLSERTHRASVLTS